jgi:hypothetical protein
MSKIDDFKVKLRALLKKYNAGIGFDVDDCTDYHGIYGQHMYIEIDGTVLETFDGLWHIEDTDIK